jgi:hypothetical protein
MSAYIVSRKTIDQLVTALRTYAVSEEDTRMLGQDLWDENVVSVAHLYKSDDLNDLPGVIGEDYRYSYCAPKRTLTALETYGLQRCYQYQSCEHPGWKTSEAYRLVKALEARLEAQLGKTYEQICKMPGYAWPNVDDDTQPEPSRAPRPVTKRFTLTETAKLVKKALKDAYPSVKWSVKSDRYALGCSIDVSWTDGPTESMVQPIFRAFSGATFDGMTDMKSHVTQEYEGEVVSFGVDYVQGQRHISTAFMTRVAAQVARQYKVAVPEVYDSGAKYGTGDHGCVAATPEALVMVENAPPFHRPERLLDVIHHVAYQTSALEKPRVQVKALARQIA